MTKYLCMTHSNRLTVEQARNLLWAAGDILDHPDILDAVFNGDKRAATSALKAAEKVRQAINQTQTRR